VDSDIRFDESGMDTFFDPWVKPVFDPKSGEYDLGYYLPPTTSVGYLKLTIVYFFGRAHITQQKSKS
jgi:ABC-type cobalt transport system substrate-binding protein